MEEYVYCPFCRLHCITGTIAVIQAPKDDKVHLIDENGKDLTAFCLENYEPEFKTE